MVMKKFTLDPVAQQPYGMASLNEELSGSTHVETYTKSEMSCGEDRTIVIFAFYPDADKEEVV